jgi:pyridoxamine 5'-phosphate oxidase
MADEFRGLRINYDSAGLDVATVPEDPIELLRAWLHDSIAAEDVEPYAITFATVGAAGAPTARVLLLRGLDARGLAFFSNTTSHYGV